MGESQPRVLLSKRQASCDHTTELSKVEGPEMDTDLWEKLHRVIADAEGKG